MQLTETVKLYPNKYQTELIKAMMSEYISTVNKLVFDAVNGRSWYYVKISDNLNVRIICSSPLIT